uniref:Uncharacterized protein n=1 Tax=Oryza punctata TaxID=4537 RepID=A0A0E0JD82_ORYPU
MEDLAIIRGATEPFMEELKVEQAVMQGLLDHIDAFPAGGASPTMEDFYTGEEIISQGIMSVLISRVPTAMMMCVELLGLALDMGATLEQRSFPRPNDIAERLALLPPPERTSYPDCDDVGLEGFAMRLDHSLAALRYAERALDSSLDIFTDAFTLIFTKPYPPLAHAWQREAHARSTAARKMEARTSLATALRCVDYAHAQATVALTRIAPPPNTTTPATNLVGASQRDNKSA